MRSDSATIDRAPPGTNNLVTVVIKWRSRIGRSRMGSAPYRICGRWQGFEFCVISATNYEFARDTYHPSALLWHCKTWILNGIML
jgi:hypothetical protein